MAHSWFPGHMAKAVREIKPLLKLIDVVIEVVDARAPMSSSNPVIEEMVKGKSVIVLLNKSDLSDPVLNRLWQDEFRRAGKRAVCSDAIKGVGLDMSLSALQAFEEKARVKPRALVIGMPNVGKSTLINHYAKRSKAKTGDKPGITRGKQWIDIGAAELLDTPGLMPLRVDDPSAWQRLCALGIINDDLFSREEAATFVLEYLKESYPLALKDRYGIDIASEMGLIDLVEAIARRRGCLLPGGAVDIEKAHMLILRDLRSGKLGRISLERPNA